jgi:hypothetical protein
MLRYEAELKTLFYHAHPSCHQPNHTNEKSHAGFPTWLFFTAVA